MEKRISDIIDLAGIYNWQVDLIRNRQVNFKNDNKDLICVYWSTIKPKYSIHYKRKKGKMNSFKECDVLFIEKLFMHNDPFSIQIDTKNKPTSITPGIVDNFLKDHENLKCGEVIGKFKDWLPK
jgi:hypothetical protein